MRGTLLAINAGTAHTLIQNGHSRRTAIGKRALDGAVTLTESGVAGDVQVDKKHHGGIYRAICVFPDEHYAWFARRIGREFPRPAFGENFTTRGLLESEVCIGDIFRVGTARVQVTQPRGPCNTLAAFLGEKQLAGWASEQSYTGWYMSVLTPGEVRAGDTIELDSRPGTGITVEQVNRARWPRTPEESALAYRALAEPLLRDDWPEQVRRSAAHQRVFA